MLSRSRTVTAFARRAPPLRDPARRALADAQVAVVLAIPTSVLATDLVAE